MTRTNRPPMTHDELLALLPATIAELVKSSKRNRCYIRDKIRKAKDAGLIHISGWDVTTSKYAARGIYSAGDAPDAPNPTLWAKPEPVVIEAMVARAVRTQPKWAFDLAMI